jgi:hypothetical protein
MSTYIRRLRDLETGVSFFSLPRTPFISFAGLCRRFAKRTAASARCRLALSPLVV